MQKAIKQYFYLASNAKNQQQKLAAILNLSNVYQSSGRSLLAIELLEKRFKQSDYQTFKRYFTE
jgi:hypothetical protein